MLDFLGKIYDDAIKEVDNSPENLVPSTDKAMDAKAKLWLTIVDVLRDLSDTERYDVASTTLSVLKHIVVTSAVELRDATDVALDAMVMVVMGKTEGE